MIPKNAPKPIDGRTKKAKEKQAGSVFRFPLYVNFPEVSFVPPLSAEEARLRQAQVDFYRCEFEQAKRLFEALSENAESIYVKICAHFYMCVLSAGYDINISWEKYYSGMMLLLSGDFPRKKEMELFLPWLDVIIGQFGKIPEKLNTDPTYEYHPSAWYLNAFLSIFNFEKTHMNTASSGCSEPFGTLCRIMERDGYYVEAQAMHFILFAYHFGAHNEEALWYHLRQAVRIAYEHDLLFTAADAENYYAEVLNAVLGEYPDSFAERVQKTSGILYRNYSQFSKEILKISVYEKLSRSDFSFVFYALEGYPNKQVASLCRVSERTAAKKYSEIYEKLGISGKQELVTAMSVVFGNKK